MPIEGLIAREGGVEDFSRVMELQKNVGFIGGLDFIPGVYRYWAHSKGFRINLVEHRGRVVGIFTSRKAPGSEEVFTMAGRVHTDYRRTGTKDLLYTSGGERVMTPDTPAVLFDAMKSNYWDSNLKDLPGILQLHRKWFTLAHGGAHRDGYQRFVRDYPRAEHVRRLSHQQVKDMTEDGSLQERILLDGKYFVPNHVWMSLPVNKESIRFCSTTGEIRVSYKGHPTGRSEGQRETLMGVSFGGVMLTDPEKGLLRADFCYYGEGMEHMYLHLSSFVSHILTVSRAAIIPVFIRCPFNLNREAIRNTLERYFGEILKLSDIEAIPTGYLMTSSTDTSKVTLSKL